MLSLLQNGFLNKPLFLNNIPIIYRYEEYLKFNM